MKIVRQDSDTLVFKATLGDDGKAKQIVAIVGCVALAGIVAFGAVHVAWWGQLETGSRLAIGVLFVAGLMAPLFVVYDLFPYVDCLALDCSSRRGLCVWKTLRRSHSEEFEFDQVEQVSIEAVAGAFRRWWWRLRLTRDNGRSIALGVQAFRNEAGKADAEALAAKVREMLGLSPSPAAQTMMSAAEERVEWAAIFSTAVFMVGFAVLVGLDAFEKWQAPSWPKAAGIVESAHVGQELHYVAKRNVLKDVIKIVYRYSVDGVEYRGTRFNVWENELPKEKIHFIKQHYRAGQACQVAYNPKHPANSFLKTDEAPRRLAFEALVCTVFGLAGSIWLAYNVRRFMRGESATDFAWSKHLKPKASAV